MDDFSRFNLPGLARVEPGSGGLTKIVIDTPLATAEIYTHGAHVAAYQPGSQKAVLWMSEKSNFAPGKPIRGGVPICFPWFGPRSDDPKLPAHGFARLRDWTIDSILESGEGMVTVTLSLTSDDDSKKLWPYDFAARHIIRVGATLEMTLAVTNTGSGPMRFEQAQHTYFTVSDIKSVGIEGLGGAQFLDKVGQPPIKNQVEPVIDFTAETDRVYQDTTATVLIHDDGWGREIEVRKRGSHATVVWNPWIAKAKAMPDFGDDEWPGMVCVETCNVQKNAVELAAGQTHEMATSIRVISAS